MQAVKDRQLLYESLFLILLVTAILLPRSPLEQSIPPRDSGVFLYVGQQILDGQIPYRDTWDHKGPVIYYLNALGLYLAQGSRWGVWWIQWLSLALAAILGHTVLRRTFGQMPALLASFAWIISLVLVLGGGNYTEEYGLLLQLSALFFFWKSLNSPRPRPFVFLLGITFAAAFWLRPNLIGVHLSIGIVALSRLIFSPERRSVFQWVLAFAAGALTVSLPLLTYFARQGAAPSLIDQFLHYNLIYSSVTAEEKIDALLEGLQLLTRSGVTFTAFAGWVIGCLPLFAKPGELMEKAPLLCVALVGLPIDLFLVSASGRSYHHYYLTWLPVFAILTAQWASSISIQFKPAETALQQFKLESRAVWTMALIVAFALPSHRDIIAPVFELVYTDPPSTPLVVKRIWNYTTPDDYLLVWGAEASYNFLSERRSPSRFMYQYPLLTCGYGTDAMVGEFLDALQRHKPLIIDTSATNRYIPPINSKARNEWEGAAFAGGHCDISARMEDVFKFIDTNYREVEVISSKGWIIYQFVDDSP
ncbi:MAG: glycosyltransferase family 39 protein [Chloroflexota bacterium]